MFCVAAMIAVCCWSHSIAMTVAYTGCTRGGATMSYEIESGMGDDTLLQMRYQEWRARAEMETLIADGWLTMTVAGELNFEASPEVMIATAACGVWSRRSESRRHGRLWICRSASSQARQPWCRTGMIRQV